MDFLRLKKVLAGFSVAAIALTQVSTALAAYSDVPSGSWYADSVSALSDYLDASQTNFRPGDNATRAEFVKLIVEMNGGILSQAPAVPSFDDVSPSAWYYNYVEDAAADQWVQGDGACVGSHPCYARPNANINRAEAAKLLVVAFNLDQTGESAQFVDNVSGQWYTDVIQTAADHCVLQGDDSTGRVRPSDSMNRAEMVVMLHRVDQGLTFGVDCGQGQVTTPSITSATAVAATKVDVEFNVDVDQTSAQTVANFAVSPSVVVSSVALLNSKTVELTLGSSLTSNQQYTVTVSNLVTAAGDMINDSAAFSGYNPLPMGNGTLEVAMSSKNPVGDSIPQGAHGVTMLSLDLTASCDDDVTVESVTVLHEGFGLRSDISGVYASVDGARASRSRSIDSKDQTVEVRFTTPLVVQACRTATVDIAADFANPATVSAEHNFALELGSDVVSNAKSISGNFPLKGNTFRVAAVHGGTVTVDYRTVSPNSAYVGDKEVLIGKYNVAANATEDQTVYSITLHQNGTVNDGDVQNIKIRRTDKTVVTNTAAAFTAKFATLTFNPPLTIIAGDNMNLEVVADITGGAASTVITDIDETSDIFTVGSLYGYGVNGQLYGSTVTMGTTGVSSLSLQAGEFTMQINGPSQQTYTRDQHGATLANLTLTTGGEEIDIKKLYVAIQAQNATGGYLSGNASTYNTIADVIQNVQLKNVTTGRAISADRLTGNVSATLDYGNGPAALTATYQIYRFTDFTVSGSDSYQINVDFIDNGSGFHPMNNDTFKVQICGTPSENANGADGTTAGGTTGCTFGGLLDPKSVLYDMQIESLTTGDKVHDVRPGGTLTGNAQRIADASLTIGVKPLSSTSTAVRNSKDVRLLKFEARSGEAKDTRITKLIFESQNGALANAQNYTLWADTDGNGVVDTKIDSGKAATATAPISVTFDTLTNGGYVIAKEKTVTFEVHADIAGSLTNTALQLRFATGATFVEAETVDKGSNLSGVQTNGVLTTTNGTLGCTGNCAILVTTTNSPSFTLVNQGNLYVTKDTTTAINPRQILAGALSEPILRLNFRGEYEQIDVTKLQFQTSSGAVASSVQQLELFVAGASTPFAVATTTNCVAADNVLNSDAYPIKKHTFCATMQNQQLIIDPALSDTKIEVRARISDDNGNGVSNQSLTLNINPVASTASTATGAVQARGVASSNNLATNYAAAHTANGVVFIGAGAGGVANAAIAGATNVTVLSKVLSIANANPDANGSALVGGATKDIGVFKFSAYANNNSNNGTNLVTLSGVTFNIQATNVGLDSAQFYFHIYGDNTTLQPCTAYNGTTGHASITTPNASGALLVTCTLDGTPSAAIASNGNLTIALRAYVTSSKIIQGNTTTLITTLTNFSNNSYTSFGTGAAATQGHFYWGDNDNAARQAFYWVEYSTDTVSSTSYTG